MLQIDKKGLIYSFIIERNLGQLFQKGIDLKPYLNSELVFHKIENINYSEHSQDDTEAVIGTKIKSFSEVCSDYDGIWGKIIPLLIEEDIESKEKRQIFQVEYIVINLKHTLNADKQFFAKQIDEITDNDITYLDIPAVMTIIDFKWDTYVFWYYAKQFAVFIFFVAALLVDLLICESQVNSDSG